MAKSFWAKISKLDEDVLNKQGEEVDVFYEEKKEKKEKKQKTKKIKESTIGKKEQFVENKSEKEWPINQTQGQILIDVYESGDFLIIESIMAGISSKDVDITVEPDLVVIRGERQNTNNERQYYYQECFWGKFSRTLILPCPIKPEAVKAELKNGVLVVRLPKIKEENREIEIQE
jgi:HSP20 family protein